MYKAILTNCASLQPEVVDIDFEVFVGHGGVEWIRPVPGVTGYESAQLKEIIKDYFDNKPVFSRWIACAGTLNKYDRLEIPMSEIIKYLQDGGRINVKREYGYIKNIDWNDSLHRTKTEEE